MFRYFRASWRKSGIAIIHTGIVLLLISGFVDRVFAGGVFHVDSGRREGRELSGIVSRP